MLVTTPYDHGAKGDGKADDLLPLLAWQAANAGDVAKGAAGNFAVSGTFQWSVPIADGHRFILSKHATFPKDTDLVRNAHVVGFGGGPIVDRLLYMEGVTIMGVDGEEPIPGDRQQLVDIAGVERLEFRGVILRDSRWPLGISNVRKFKFIEDCEIANFGGSGGSIPDRGKCLWGGGYGIWMGPGVIDAEILDVHIHESTWHPFLLNARKALIRRAHIHDVGEGGIFGGDGSCNELRVLDSIIERVRRIDCAANGAELKVRYKLEFKRNQIEGCDHANIHVTDTPNFEIEENIFGNACQELDPNEPPDVNTVGPITLRSSDNDPERRINNGSVAGNVIFANTGKPVHAVFCVNWGGQPFTNTTIGPNFIEGKYRGEKVYVGPGVRGQGFKLLEAA